MSEEAKPSGSEPAKAGATPHLWRQELSGPLMPQTGPTSVFESPTATRKRKVFRVLCVMLALAGAIVGVLSWLRPLPEPAFFPIWVASYQSPLVPFINQSGRDRDAFREGKFFNRTNPNAYINQELAFIDNELTGLEQLTGSQSVIVYLSAYAAGGTVTQDDQTVNQVLIFPGDVVPDQPATKLPLRRVLEALRACEAEHKLLMLDIMRPLARLGEPGIPPGRLGLLSDDVAGRIHAELAAVPDPNRLVLLSCSPGQFSLGSEYMGRSVFSYYVEAGLRGGAEGYGPDGRHWGRIDVQELADFVRSRVDQWAWRNCGLRQTPMLLGEGGNFQIISLDHGVPESPPALREPQTYPQWLLEDFQQLDQWRADGSARIRPRAFRQLEAMVLRSEQSWRGGSSASEVENIRRPFLDAVTKRLAEARQAITHPDPRSLALTVAQGQVPDPKLVEAVRALVVQAKTQAQGLPPDKAKPVLAKLADDFWKKQKDVPLFDLSWAVFESAMNESRPTPELIVFLNGLLQAKTPVPHYVETLCLDRLAELAQAGGDWPAETVHRLLQVTGQGEQANSHFRAFTWMRTALDEADQARFNAEYMFWARGYAPLSEADRLLRQALEAYGQVLAIQDSLLTAQQTRDEAMALIPGYVSYLDRTPQDERAWFEAVQAAIDLTELLVPGATPPTTAQLRQLGDTWRQKCDVLRGYIEQLRRPFGADNQARLIKGAKQPATQAAIAAEIDAMLTTSLLAAEDRVALWKAMNQLARELVESSLEADQEPNNIALNPLLADLDQQHLERAERDNADMRARMAIALLQLGGLADEEIRRLEAARSAFVAKGDSASLDALGQAVQNAWSQALPAQLAAETNPYRRERLGWMVAPFDSNRILDEAATNPTLVIAIAETRALWGWLADSYRRRSRDLPGGGFFLEVAREYQNLSNLLPAPEPRIQIATASPLPRLTPATPTGSLAIQLTPPSTTPLNTQTGAEFDVISPAGDWLRVVPEIPEATQQPQGPWPIRFSGPTAQTIWLKLALQPGAESAGLPAMQGIIVTVKSGGRTFHQKVTLAVLPLGNRPEILLSADPNTPAPPLGSVRLRTVKTPQPIFVYVRNPTDKTFTLNGEIQDGTGTLLGSAAKVPLMPREVRRLAFAAPPAAPPPATPGAAPAAPPPPPTGLPELTGPLQIRLVDAANPVNVFDVRVVDVDIALPREYVQVARISYQPANVTAGTPDILQASLRATAPLNGPPCQIEMTLPVERIPGFLGAKEGTFRGELPPPDGTLSLFARSLLFSEGSPRTGTVCFNVDGYERAFLFNTSFARSGDAVTPQQDYRPDLRLKADRYAQASSKFNVTLEVDNAPTGATLDLALGLSGSGGFQPELTRVLPEPRRRRIGFKADGPSGALLFDAAIQDWTVAIDASLILGPRTLRARLLDASGAEIRVVTQDVTLVNSAPANVQIIQAPKQALKGAPIQVQAMGFDSQSGIQQVQFFLGKPVDNQLPPKTATIAAAPSDTDANIWVAQVPIPESAAGPLDLSVQFTNKAGLSSFASTTIQVVDKLVPPDARIVGRLMEGPRPQAGLEVVLRDPKGAELMKTKTDAEGNFSFDKVMPGSYTLTAAKEVAKRTAELKVTVMPGQTLKVVLELML